MVDEVKSVVKDLIINYMKIEDSTEKDRTKLVDNIFKKLDTNKNGKLDDNDKMNNSWKSCFGIDASSSLSKTELADIIESIGFDIIEDTIDVENDYSEEYYKAQDEDENFDSYCDGYNTADDLIGYTNDTEYNRVETCIQKLNKNNIREFLKGYCSNDTGGNGFFLQLALETTKFKNKDVVPAMRAAIDSITEEEKENNKSAYKELRRICKKYESMDKEKDFKLTTWGWGWDRLWGNDELQKFDNALEQIFSLRE